MILLFISVAVYGQDEDDQNIKPGSFCGYRFKDTAQVRSLAGGQLAFLQINDRDTIVDIGSSSGAYDGAFCTIGNFKAVHFVLTDISSYCLDSNRVNNMIAYYSRLRGSALPASFSRVICTTDSLMLPANSYKKVWVFNTLHEVSDKQRMARQIAAILQSGGELIVAELMATERNPIHKGCKKKLMSKEEIVELFAAAGINYKDEYLRPESVGKKKNPYYLFRFIKN